MCFRLCLLRLPLIESSQNANYNGNGSRSLHVISRKKLLDAERKHGRIDLDPWYRIAKSASWKNLLEVRESYSSADGVPVGDRVYTVFNISGNSFRLVTEINYEGQKIFIRHVLTHAEYEKGDWKK